MGSQLEHHHTIHRNILFPFSRNSTGFFSHRFSQS